ncbi:MAG: hypothetical protein KBT87_14540 [Gammaproteobacteria bacterium]|nr:hypothetical protein [Gammaproteobacteria bacterium]MBQ0775886.1 hypothetical protein [Gammaproteobacteria bacterium]
MTTFILLTLSFILMGKAIAALQEAAVISVSPLPFDITFSWLGIYSTWEGVAAQLTIILLAAGMLRIKSRTKKLIMEKKYCFLNHRDVMFFQHLRFLKCRIATPFLCRHTGYEVP